MSHHNKVNSGGIVGSNKRSPTLTIKRVGSAQAHWQDFIDREHSSVDQLMKESFAQFCQDHQYSMDRLPSGVGEHLERRSSFSTDKRPAEHGGLQEFHPGAGASSACSLVPQAKFGSLHRQAPNKSKFSLTMGASGLPICTMPRRSPSKRLVEDQKSVPLFINEDDLATPFQHLIRRKDSPYGDGAPSSSFPSRVSPPKRSPSPMGSIAPPGIQELETLYAPMKNLLSQLPNARKYSGNTMPALHPLSDFRTNESFVLSPRATRDDDLESEACSVIFDVPPPLPPIQSHAILQESLGHEIPRRSHKMLSDWSVASKGPPVPPKRVLSSNSGAGSKMMVLRPNHLNLSQSPSPSHSGIYANAALHRSSLMSTGSSENSDSSLPSFENEIPVTPVTPSSEQEVFAWPNYRIWGESPSPSEEHRSVSQIGEPPGSSAASDCSGPHSVNTSAANGGSGVYLKMNPRFPPVDKDTHYMNILYNAVQKQGGGGSVESAMSPYIAMTSSPSKNNVKLLPNANVDVISAIYAHPQLVERSGSVSSIAGVTSSSSTRCRSSSRSGRFRSNSASRLYDVTRMMTSRSAKKKLSSTSSPGAVSSSSTASKARAVAEFKELMHEVERKRAYRVGLNLFNSKPDLGVEFLAQRNFLELTPESVAKFLHDNSSLSREKIGEYLGNLQSPFCMQVLSCFVQEFNFTSQRIDKSLRHLLEVVRVPGEAQKIEKIMEVFGERHSECNPSFANKLKSRDSVVTLAFAAMLLNTDLHTPNVKEERRMSLDDFVNNLRGVDANHDFDPKLLKSIYKGIKKHEFVTAVDHVMQTQLIQGSIHGVPRKTLNLAETHRRLVCLCRLYEVIDINAKKEPASPLHQRDIFLFNDLLVVTKQSSKSTKNNPMYAYRDNFLLRNLEVTLFHTPVYKFGIQITQKRDNRVLITLNASSEHDRYKFVMDLQESIYEMDLMDRVLSEFNR
eukprot:snap_masked-scaffold853_size88743-processed-gene-0.8 protein:Tk09859 transcript:snap_masked-scaffold853_size88743-processed-gene-0.8-mRNA-1 annotation:"iq motif and sec7 domain-containing protein 2 isoform x6"